jgi:chromosome segregation ATPase
MELSPELLSLIKDVGIGSIAIVIVLLMLRRSNAANARQQEELSKQASALAQRAADMDKERAEGEERLANQIQQATEQSQRSTEIVVTTLTNQVNWLGVELKEHKVAIAALREQRDKLQLEFENAQRRLAEMDLKLSQNTRDIEKAAKELRIKDETIANKERSEREAIERANRLELEKRELLEYIRRLEEQLTEINARVAGLEAADGIKTDKLRKIETGLLVDPAAKKDAA